MQTDTMLGAFLLLRRAMLDEIGGWDAGYRIYCEDIDLNYRAAKAGWERWYVPRRDRPPRVRGGDRQALPDAAHDLARARDGCGSCASIPSGCSRSGDELGQVRGRGRELVGGRVRRRDALSRRSVPSSSVTLGPRLEPGDVVLDLACGDGGLGDFLPEQRYLGVDASAEMVAAGRARGRDVVLADLNDYVAGAAGCGDDDLPRDLLRARPPRALRARSPATRRRSSSST